MPAKSITNRGKSMFVKEVLNDNPLANAQAVNEAWRAAGMSGRISTTLVSNMRSRMGLAGNLRGRRRRRTKTTGVAEAGSVKSGTRRGRPRRQVQSEATRTTQVKTRGRKSELMNLEIELDRLLMKVVETGALPEVENALRKARRHLYAGLAARS
jgi:hypothetical protein